jgi:F-type H+-transporting ATPase subunit gamma
MAGMQVLKRRLHSVRSTRQITKAMQMVAASHLRRAQEAAAKPQAYARAAGELLQQLQASAGAELQRHPLYQHRDGKRTLVIAIASDRGLAGAYNQNVLKALQPTLVRSGTQLITVGQRVSQPIAATANLTHVGAYSIDVENVTPDLVEPIATQALELFINQMVDEVQLVSTRFMSISHHEVQLQTLLPLETSAPAPATVLNPAATSLLSEAANHFLKSALTTAILEARAAEQSARMLAMMNATDNAGDLIDDLTLTLNDVRQNAITQELAEITGGAEAMNG